MRTKIATYITAYIAGVLEACPEAEVNVRCAPSGSCVWQFRVAIAHAEQLYTIAHAVDETLLESEHSSPIALAVHEVAHFKRSLKAAQL